MEALFFVIDIAAMILLLLAIRRSDKANADHMGIFSYIDSKDTPIK